MTGLALLYEHPRWFDATFAALDRAGLDWRAIHADGHAYNPADPTPPARVILNRVAMSSFLREAQHPIFYSHGLMAHWRAGGARVLNGADVLALDASKARQMSLVASLGLAIPATRVVHRAADLAAAAATLRWPVVVKANIGGSGAGIVRYDTPAELAAAVADGATPDSIDRVLLVQEFVPVRDGRVIRLETMAGRLLYAVTVEGGGGFDLCPADACLAGSLIRLARFEADAALVDAAERIARAARLDLGGIEAMVDDRDGTVRFHDVNALSNFVADPLAVLGWDPHERLADWLKGIVAEAGR